MKTKTNYLKFISDTLTPVSIFLKIRDVYNKVFLLESSDYKGSDNSLSYICFDSVSQISINDNSVKIKYDNNDESYQLNNKNDACYYFQKDLIVKTMLLIFLLMVYLDICHLIHQNTLKILIL